MPKPARLIPLPVDEPIWDRFFSVFPLVLIGTREEDGGHDLAPKHMAMPMSWGNWFGFVCSPRHRTYVNAQRTGEFTVNYIRSDQVVVTSLAAAPRCGEDEQKPALAALSVMPAQTVDGVLVEGCSLYLECRLDRTVDDLGENSLLIGKVVAARVDADAIRSDAVEDDNLLHEEHLFVYLHPGRFAVIDRSHGFPFPAGFKR